MLRDNTVSARDLADNHAHSPVPDGETVSGIRIAVVIIGVAITLPAFLVGTQIVGALGLVDGGLAIFLGGAFLALLGVCTMLIGSATRLSTYTIVQFCFGRRGSLLVNAILAFTLFGWYGVTAVLFGRTMSLSVEAVFAVSIPQDLFTIVGTVLMILTTIYGFRAIEKLSRVAVPLLGMLVIYGVWEVTKGTSIAELATVPPRPNESLASLATGISVVIGSFMVGVTLVPDLARFARGNRDAFTGSLLSYGFGSPLVLFLAGLPVLVAAEPDLILAMTGLGLGLPALVVMVFATWTTNINNLYSASLSIAQILPGARDWVITVAAGVIGTAVALVGIMEYFVDFLILLSIVVPPIAGVYLADYFWIRPRRIDVDRIDSIPNYRVGALVAWAIASVFGLLANVYGWRIVGVTAVDTLLVASALLTVWEAPFWRQWRLS